MDRAATACPVGMAVQSAKGGQGMAMVLKSPV
jgi:hypothetical protein